MLTPYTYFSLADVLKLPLKKIVLFCTQLKKITVAIALLKPGEPYVFRLGKTSHAHMLAATVEFGDVCHSLDLTATESATRKLIQQLRAGIPSENGKISFVGEDLIVFEKYASDVLVCLEHESAAVKALVTSTKYDEFFDSQKCPFGSDVQNNFSSLLDDVDSAGRCLALGEPTASVFHSMRIMEGALRSVHLCLGLQSTFAGGNRNWGVILNEIKKDIDARGPQWTEKDDFEEIHLFLSGVKNAWRNPTMHINKTHSEERADDILSHVKSFLRRIAARMDENGLPLA